MAVTHNQDDTPMMLAAFKQQLVANLTKSIMDEIKPKVLEAAKKAVEELHPAVQKHYNTMAQEVIFRLAINGVEQ